MCWKCGKKNTVQMPVSRSAVCEACGTDIRSCKNCKFYDPGAHYDCHETVDEPVADKERANFCGYFAYADPSSAGTGGGTAGADAKKAFAALFGD